MPDARVIMRQGEKLYAYGIVSASGDLATVTIQGTPTYELLTPDGTSVDAGNVAGYDAGALASARVWAAIDAAALDLAPGEYIIVFNVSALGSDGLTRTRKPILELRVLSLTA